MSRMWLSTTLFGVGLVAASAALIGETNAQEANIPGIIGGAVEGDAAGAAGAAMGYDYWGRSGYYPGSRGTPYPPYQRPYYGPSYGPAYGRPYSPYATEQPRYRTTYRPIPANPSASAEPYRAVILNPKENQATLRFSVNGRLHELEPGEQKVFNGRMPRVIRFDRGRGREEARYRLSNGRYTFTPTDKGWELYRRPLEPSESAENPAPDPQAAQGETTAGENAAAEKAATQAQPEQQ